MNKDIEKDIEQKLNYWRWFIKGSGGRPGYKRLLNWWIFNHIAVGLALSEFVPVCLEQAATAVLIPLSGVYVGLAFAWAVNSQSLMQSDEIQILAEHKEGGFLDYIFTYQTAILVMLITLILWGLSGLKIFDEYWPFRDNRNFYFAIKVILFTLSSLTLRECWHVVMGTHWMLIMQQEIKRRRERSGK